MPEPLKELTRRPYLHGGILDFEFLMLWTTYFRSPAPVHRKQTPAELQ
jgi:hypothetical protein